MSRRNESQDTNYGGYGPGPRHDDYRRPHYREDSYRSDRERDNRELHRQPEPPQNQLQGSQQGSNIDKYLQVEPEPMEVYNPAQESTNASGQSFTVDETEIQSKYSDLVQYAKSFAEKQESGDGQSTSQGGMDQIQQHQLIIDPSNPQLQQGLVQEGSQNVFTSQVVQPKVLPTNVLAPGMSSYVTDLSGLGSIPTSLAGQRPMFVTPNMANLAALAQKLQQQQQQQAMLHQHIQQQQQQNIQTSTSSQLQTSQPSVSTGNSQQDQISQAIAQANANALAAVAASQQQQRLQLLQNRTNDMAALGTMRPHLSSLFPGGNPLGSLHGNSLLGGGQGLLNPQIPLAAGLPAAGLSAAQLMQLGIGGSPGQLPPGMQSNPASALSASFLNPAGSQGMLGGAGMGTNGPLGNPGGNPLAMQQSLLQQQLLNNLLQPPPQPQ